MANRVLLGIIFFELYTRSITVKFYQNWPGDLRREFLSAELKVPPGIVYELLNCDHFWILFFRESNTRN